MPKPARAALTAALLILLTTFAAAPAGAAERFNVDVARSAYGIPHIKAKDFASLGYGYGYTIAEDNICVLAESYVTVSAQRARFFGADKGYTIRGNGSSANNLNSDFFYQAIIDSKRVERLVGEAPPRGPRPEVKELARGYVAGYNAYLRDIGGSAGVTDPVCKGKEWVRPIDEITLYRRFHSLSLLASSGVAIDGIAGAAPVTGPPAGEEPSRALAPGEIDRRLGGLGSNAVALGSESTTSGNGLLYGNPHFPWEGPERFYQSHLTIPGKLDVAGGSLLGVPLVLIGHTQGMAWSHTVSTARRFTPFELRLVPGSPTTYLVDGQPREMLRRRVTVDTGDGKRSRTLFSSHHGPILTGILGLPIFPWTPERAFALGDANVENFGRLLNHFFEVNQAQTVDQVDGILKKYLGIPWVNTVVADTSGKAYYADIGSIPNVSAAKLADCRTAVGVALDTAQRLPVLDGSRAACEWDTDADAIASGIFGPKNLPSMTRSDFTSNLNDSHWLTNPKQPLEGFSRIIGDERAARSLRTRGGLRLIEDRLAGRDGLAGSRFDLDSLRAVALSNRVYASELWREELVAFCKQNPTVPSASGPVPTAGACEALEAFNGRDDLDAKGAVLFRRFATKALASSASPYDVPFSAEDPVNTPRGLNTENPQVRQALGDAINDVKNAGLPFDAPLRGLQFEKRNLPGDADENVPIHGGPGGTGVFNVITAPWNGRNFGDVNHGSSFVQAVELAPGCPRARTILTYSQSTNEESPFYADQTRLYATKGWVTPPFCKKDTDRLLPTSLSGARSGLLRSVRVAPARQSIRVRIGLRSRADVVVTARRGTKVVARVARTRLAARTHLLRLRTSSGPLKVTVSARAGTRRDVVRTAGRAR